MSRFLFVVPPEVGHTFPTVAVGQELTNRGPQVAWAGYPEAVRPLLPPSARLIPVAASFGGETRTQIQARSLGLRGAAAFRFHWADYAIPLATSMVPGVTAAVDEFRPDVLVVDQLALAGALVAHQRGLPWATSATTSVELTDPLALLPKLADWALRHLDAVQRGFGVSEGQCVDLRFSEHLVLVFSTEALIGPVGAFPSHYAFVGPSIGVRAGADTFPWGWLDPSRQHVLVSLGTCNREAGRRFFATAVAAVAPLAGRLQAILVAPSDHLGPVPDHVLVREFVPQLDLLAHLDAVVSHAGHNTVCETLAHGVPLVVAPIRDDQPAIARQVTDVGAGVRVRFGRVGTTEFQGALPTGLDAPSYRAAARRVQASFAAAGGAAAAADHLEKLL